MQPSGSDPGAIGLIVNFFGIPLLSTPGSVTFRPTTGNVGANLNLDNIPDNYWGVGLQVVHLRLTIFGSVGGKWFTRNPTQCGQPAVSTLTTSSYGDPAPISATSSFTPSGCANVAYQPQLTTAVVPDTADSGLAFGAQITQTAFESATQSLTFTPAGSLTPSLLALLADLCNSPTFTGCTSVGMAYAGTPLLAQPQTAKLYLMNHPGALPTVTTAFGPPLNIQIDGTVSITSSPIALHVAFGDLPDAPLTTLGVVLAGGPGSLFIQGTHLCSTPQATTGDLTAQDGATQVLTSTIAVTGCQGAAAATAASATGGLLMRMVRANARMRKPLAKRSTRRARSARH
jgi:hypothetical protein